MRRNQALTFVKPHAVRSQATLTYILDTFADHGIDVLDRRTVTADEIRAGGLIDRHYAANARRGTFDNASALELKDSAKEAFRTAFEEDWDDAVRAGRVFSGEAMRIKLGNISGEDLNTQWARYGARKLSGGCYASFFEEQDCYVVNGFYPSIREQFARPGAAIGVLVVAFDLPWAEFRRDVIGSTNPAAADEASIRGYVHDHAEALGLVVDSRDNVIHASASPFEALCERLIWMPDRPIPQDPLWKLIHKKVTLSSAELSEHLLAWHAANPMVELPGRSGPLLDVFEDRDTPDVAADLLRLLNPS
jgi:nucleoside diphosphate kinase